ncbi:DUF975 family protein [Carnobacterium gallinarum]|uniref:DUF975 family protein n=1 Tax=Carnobacterium gallinarum TaxID=2749 RepID=UPI00054E3040|nr:DUF975 family protein [Carnobacterium gallinarum]
MNSKEIKKVAKKYLSGNWGTAIGSLFIMFFVAWAVNMFMSLASGMSTMLQAFSSVAVYGNDGSADQMINFLPMLFGNIVLFVIYIVVVTFVQQLLAVGYKWGLLDLIDGKAYSVGSLFQVFNRTMFKTMGLMIMISIFTGLWSLLFIIPGLVKGYSYSQAYNILKDNPEIGILDAITASRRLMDGKKGNLFVLQLTFVLWYLIPVILGFILTIVVVGAMSSVSSDNPLGYFGLLLLGYMAVGVSIFGLSLYLTPYQQTSEQVFYRRLTDSM